jgi:hypothetical protein
VCGPQHEFLCQAEIQKDNFDELEDFGDKLAFSDESIR